MDVFSLLKFWRNAAAACDPTVTGDIDSSIDDDEESFFDLVFTNSGDEDNNSDFANSPSLNVFGGFQVDSGNSNSSFRFSSSPVDVNLNNKRKILPLDSINSKMPQSPLRNFMLGFQNVNNKSKLEKNCEIEEVKIGSSIMLKRDNSLRQKLITEKLLDNNNNNNDQMPSKRFSKDVVNKYLNLMKKPSYVKVSKKNNEKSNLSEKSITPSSSPASSVFSPRKEEKRGGGGGGGGGSVFREVRKHLGKSRSASAILQTPLTKNDDSALEQQDGIQSAILHCKKSYNSPSSQECCVLSRSGSAPSNNQIRISIEEEKRSSI